MCCAAGFQVAIDPSNVVVKMASFTDSRMARSSALSTDYPFHCPCPISPNLCTRAANPLGRMKSVHLVMLEAMLNQLCA
jgi:hypothetical protein